LYITLIGLYYFNRLLGFFFIRFLLFSEDFSFALNHEHEDFLVYTHLFEKTNTNTKIFLSVHIFLRTRTRRFCCFQFLTNTNTKIFGFAKQHEHEHFLLDESRKWTFFARQHEENFIRISRAKLFGKL